VVRAGPAPKLEAIGFEVRDRRELARLAGAVEDAGVSVVDGTPEQCAARHVTGPDEPTYAITKGEFWGREFFPPPAP
jgi:hypothetical protein